MRNSVLPILLILFVSGIVVAAPGQNGSREVDRGHSELGLETILDNATGLGEISNFLLKSQDTSAELLPSMDQAYYIGMALIYLQDFQDFVIPEDFVEMIWFFLDSARNIDGSYGNWKHAIGSMESTFQAIRLLHNYGLFERLSESQVNQTAQFVQNLQTMTGGYYPLQDWDAPDMTSTYRALKIFDILQTQFPSLQITINYNITAFIEDNYVDPFFITGGSGYSENTGGPMELLATTYAILSLELLDDISPHAVAVSKYLGQLRSGNGGVAGDVNGLPTTGFTYRGIQLYLVLNSSSYNLDLSQYLPSNFVPSALGYIQANKNPGEGFTSSDRDSTSEKSSTYFSLSAFSDAYRENYTIVNLDLDSVQEYLLSRPQALFGIGNYPGDTSEMSYTARGLAALRLLNRSFIPNPAIKTFVLGSYDPDNGGFGYRPGASTRVKYTYYGIKALRELSDPLIIKDDILDFVIATQNEDGGFGERPGSTISYMTHTYWAISSLILLGERLYDHLNISMMIDFLNQYRNQDGTYSNYPGLNSSIISTYRGIYLSQLFGQPVSSDDTIRTTLFNFQKSNGGFVSSLDNSVPNAESTFFGVALAKILNIPLNYSRVREYVMSLHNPDGGFSTRNGFSSRVSSTYFCISTLYLLDNITGQIQEDVADTFNPLIYPSFNPSTDTNDSFHGSYVLRANVLDPESRVNDTWIELEWDLQNNSVDRETILGRPNNESPHSYIFTIGPFNQNGTLKFRYVANDTNGNLAVSDWYYLITVASITTPQGEKTSFSWQNLVPYLPWIFILLSILDGSFTYRKRKKLEESEIKMQIYEHDNENSLISSFNVFYIFLAMGVLSYIARLFLGDAQLILENSLFLFRFLLAALVILFARYVVGISTYGFFGTSVLALSWLALGPLWGFMIFLNVFTMAYIIRKLLDPYHLAVGFRVGIVMVFTITSLAVFELLGEIFRIQFLTTSILLPIIITPWMTDRYVQTESEESSYDAFVRLVGTVSVIALSYMAMAYDPLVLFVTLHPETWVVLIAFIFYLGRSRYYTLFDLRRFKRLFNANDEPLTMLSRNRDYLGKYNTKLLFPIINKFRLKEQFDEWKVPNPELYAVISEESEIDAFIDRAKSDKRMHQGFAIKPSESYGGRGIVLVKKIEGGYFIIGDEKYHDDAVRDHIRKILQGEYLTSQTNSISDIVLIEEKIVADEKFGALGIGLPDVRVILFLGIPVMVMARIPTKESDGLANLKQGAIGAAISIKTGEIYRAEWKRNQVNIHPDTHMELTGFKFENWNEFLAIACLAQKSTGLGYAGVDLVLDQSGKIYVLEVNKRPGLEIQNINLKGLLTRLEQIEELGLDAMDLSPLRSAAMGRELAEKYWEVDL